MDREFPSSPERQKNHEKSHREVKQNKLIALKSSFLPLPCGHFSNQWPIGEFLLLVSGAIDML